MSKKVQIVIEVADHVDVSELIAEVKALVEQIDGVEQNVDGFELDPE